MYLALFALDMWIGTFAAALLLWSWLLPALVGGARRFTPEARARRLLGYALVPWVAAWLTVVLAFTPSWLVNAGWIADWCLSRHHAMLAYCPMHGSRSEPDPIAPLLAALTLALTVATAVRAGWMIRTALRVAAALGLARQRRLDVDGLQIDIVDSTRPLAVSLCLPKARVVVSANVVAALDTREFRALLEHERAHLARYDGLAALLVAIASAPLLPRTRELLRSEWHLAVEQCCDRIAAYRTDTLTLASALLKFARLSNAVVPDRNALLAGFDQSDFGIRVSALLDPQPSADEPLTRLRWWLALCVPLALVLHEAGEFLLLPLVR